MAIRQSGFGPMEFVNHLNCAEELVVIDDFHFVTMAITPNKTDSPLIVDTNRVLPFTIASQGFQLVSGR